MPKSRLSLITSLLTLLPSYAEKFGLDRSPQVGNMQTAFAPNMGDLDSLWHVFLRHHFYDRYFIGSRRTMPRRLKQREDRFLESPPKSAVENLAVLDFLRCTLADQDCRPKGLVLYRRCPNRFDVRVFRAIHDISIMAGVNDPKRHPLGFPPALAPYPSSSQLDLRSSPKCSAQDKCRFHLNP